METADQRKLGAHACTHTITTSSAPTLFIHPSSTHQLNLFPLAGSCTILAPYLPSLPLSEFLFNLQEMLPLMGLLIWCCASCFYLQELKEVRERRDALPTRSNQADWGFFFSSSSSSFFFTRQSFLTWGGQSPFKRWVERSFTDFGNCRIIDSVYANAILYPW